MYVYVDRENIYDSINTNDLLNYFDRTSTETNTFVPRFQLLLFFFWAQANPVLVLLRIDCTLAHDVFVLLKYCWLGIVDILHT